MQYIKRTILSAAIACTVVAGGAHANMDGQPAAPEACDPGVGGLIGLRFTQRGFDDGARLNVKMWGEDLNGDGVLYSMSGFLASILPGPMAIGSGNELIRVELEFVDFFGIPRFRQVWDERVTPIMQEPGPDTTMFFGFSYNLDGGEIGDDMNEGVSFSPLAPSVSYTMGPIFQQILGPGFTELFSCGAEGTVCAAVTQLKATPEPPGFALTNEAYSNEPITVTSLNQRLPRAR